MKTTLSSTFRTMQQYLNLNSSRLLETQIVAVSGKKLQKASDNPGVLGQVFNLRAQLQDADLFLQNGQEALGRLKAQDTELGQADSLMVRAIELTTAAGNGVYGASERAGMADEIHGIREEILALANSQMDGKYFYSGFQTLTPPFVDNPAYDPVLDPRPVLYNGDYGAIQLEISPDEKMTVNFTGNAVFLGDEDGDGVVDGGQVNVFAVLTDLETALRANDQVGATAQLDNLYQAQGQLVAYRAKAGSAANRLDRAQDEMLDAQIDLRGILSKYEDADLAEAYTEMTKQEQALQASLDVAGRISKLNIFDYF